MPGIIGWPELILVLVILIFIFGAGRIKEIVKALGQGVGEFKKATSEAATTPSSSSKATDEEAVREAARKMGISVEGKSTSQLVEEMAGRVKGSK